MCSQNKLPFALIRIGFAIIFLNSSISGFEVPIPHEKKTFTKQQVEQLRNFGEIEAGREYSKLILDFKSKPDNAKLRSLGIVKMFGDDKWFSAYIPTTNINKIQDEFTNFQKAKPVYPALALSIPVGEEIGLYNTPLFMSRGFDGGGVKVAIIDGGFCAYKTAVNDGALPSNLHTVNYSSSAIDAYVDADSFHGTAVAAVVHEVAPGAELYLIKIEDVAGVLNAKNFCQDNGIRIINVSMGWFGDGWGKGDGDIYTKIVEPAFDSGILWVNSAGNQARMTYYSDFIDGNSDTYHDFPGSSVSGYGVIYSSSATTLKLFLNWDAYDAFNNYLPFSIYYLYLYDSLRTTILASSTYNQPYQTITINVPAGNIYYRIRKISGSGSEKMRVMSYTHEILPCSTNFSIMPPSDGEKALCVGAIAFSNWTNNIHTEYYSSRGPAMDGRIKPDICGIDAMTNYIYRHFTGTSASSPSVAGLAALILSKEPYLTVDQLFNRLRDNAVDIGVTGPDNTFGYGKVNLLLFPMRRNVDDDTTNKSVIINSIVKADRKVYYYGVHLSDKIILRSLSGEKIKEFTPLQGLFATGENYIDLSAVRLAKGMYILQFIGKNNENVFKKIIINN